MRMPAVRIPTGLRPSGLAVVMASTADVAADVDAEGAGVLAQAATPPAATDMAAVVRKPRRSMVAILSLRSNPARESPLRRQRWRLRSGCRPGSEARPTPDDLRGHAHDFQMRFDPGPARIDAGRAV